MELVFAATRAHRAGLRDIEQASYQALEHVAPGSALLADVDAVIHWRLGDDLVRAACAGGTSRAGTRCLQAHSSRGDLHSALEELNRLRVLRGNPDYGRETELSLWLAHGELERALAVYHSMPAVQRSLAVLGAAVEWAGAMPTSHASASASSAKGNAASSPGASLLKQSRADFVRDLRLGRDAPFAYEPLGRLLGVMPDPAAELDREGRDIVARDRAEAFLPGAATAVLRHLERYELDGSGLLYYRVYDLRRVSGTTDVAEGAASNGPTIEGRSVVRLLRQRIHKRDGRVLDPDPQATGAQGHTELTQLESGDYVEILSEGWALPEDSGQIVVDTADLLPLRTSVREAEIRFTRPKDLPLALWTHSLLGAAESEPARGSGSAAPGPSALGALGPAKPVELVTSVWRLSDQAPRRIEEGVAPLEARVGLSFGTDSWQRISASIAERLRSLDESDPYVAQWVHEVVGTEPLAPDKQVGRLVAAVGRKIKEADAESLSDFVGSVGGGAQRETARTFLEQGRGSRTWVVHRALRELGIPSRIVVSETDPFSASAGFPAHVGRFRHPLVLAELGGNRLWIDADVSGPPLPPGTVSPELRGRKAMQATGELLTVEGAIGLEPDEIDIRLGLDPSGDASGTFTALIHGEAAQQLADQFDLVVGSERTELLRNVVLGWMPWADVREVTLSSEVGSWLVAVRANVAVPGFAQPEGRDGHTWSLPGMDSVHAVYPKPEATTLGARFTAQGGRSSDLSIDTPLLFHVHRRIDLGPGTDAFRMPKPIEIKGKHIDAARTMTQSGATLEEDFRLNLPAGTIPLGDFEQFASEVQLIDDGFLHGTQIRAPGGAKGQRAATAPQAAPQAAPKATAKAAPQSTPKAAPKAAPKPKPR